MVLGKKMYNMEGDNICYYCRLSHAWRREHGLYWEGAGMLRKSYF